MFFSSNRISPVKIVLLRTMKKISTFLTADRTDKTSDNTNITADQTEE